MLNDFVNENYEVYDLTTFNIENKKYEILCKEEIEIPKEKVGYINYVEGTNSAIDLRNKRLENTNIC